MSLGISFNKIDSTALNKKHWFFPGFYTVPVFREKNRTFLEMPFQKEKVISRISG